jgi:hypothetical protein
MKYLKSTIIIMAGLAAWIMAQPAVPALSTEKERCLSFKRFNVGFAAGITSGYGLSYRTWNSKGGGYQFTLMPFLDWNQNHQSANISAGILKNHVIFDFPVEAPSTNLYQGANIFIYGGGNYNLEYTGDDYLGLDYSNSPASFGPRANYDNSRGEHWDQKLTAGLGIGTEIHFWILNWSLMVGYAGSRNWEKYEYYQKVANPRKSESGFELTPSVETTFYFNFGRF